jgi:hypothetical protein
VLFIDEESGFPEASLLNGLIIVARPLSCIASELGAPVRVGSEPPSFLNDLHSAPGSWDFSERTYPHFEQNRSPVTSSANKEFFPQRKQIKSGLDITMKMVLDYFYSKNLTKSF